MPKGERETERDLICERQYQTLAIVKMQTSIGTFGPAYNPSTSLHDNQQQEDRPQKSTMLECPPSGSHRRFHEKPSTSIEGQETRKLKCAQCLLAYEKRAYFSKMKSAIVKYRRKMVVSEVRSGVLKSYLATNP